MIENTELARLAIKQMEAFPETVDMATWGVFSSCGTVACAAGHVMLAAGHKLEGMPDRRSSKYVRPDGSKVTSYSNEASGLLGADEETTYRLHRLFSSVNLDAATAVNRFREICGITD